MSAWRLAAAASAGLALLMLPTVGGGAEQVSVRAGSHNGYARLVFDWKSPIEYLAKIDGRELIVSFGRALEADFAQVHRNVKDYVALTHISEDGKVVRVTLKGDYRLRHFVNEGSVVLDLLPAATTAKGQAPAVPAQPPRAASTPSVLVRVGEHAKFSRVVFDWKGNVDYDVRLEDRRARIRFARPARLTAERLLKDPPRGVANPRVTANDTGVGVGFDVPAGARLRHFRDGFKVVVDVVLGAPSARLSPAAPAAEAAAKQAQPAYQAAPAAAQAVAPLEALVRAPPPVENQAVMLPPKQEPAGEEDAAKAQAAPVHLIPGVETPPAAPEGEAGPRARSSMPQGAKPQPWTPQEVPADAPRLKLRYRADLDGGVLEFPFAQATRAAAFRRGGHVWLIFDTLVNVDTTELEEAGEIITDSQQMGHASATVVRLSIVEGFNPNLGVDDNEWTVRLMPEVMNPDQPITPRVDGEAYGGLVRLVSKEVGDAVALHDPEIGDDFWAIPVGAPGLGMEVTYTFNDLRLPRTAQGVAVESYSGELKFRRDSNGLDITRGDGMALSPTADRALGSGWSAEGAIAMRMFDFASWRGDPNLGFQKSKHMLQEKVVALSRNSRNGARLELARLYFARNAAADAIGVIDTMLDEQPDLIYDPAFRALRGASYFLHGNYSAAAKDLGAQVLDAEPEIQLWRGALAAASGDWETASRGFRRGAMFLAFYPDELSRRFRMLAAEVAINNNDAHEAGILLESLGKLEFEDIAERARFNVLRARLLALRDEHEAAIELLDWSIKVGDRRGRAEATFARIELMLAQGQITQAEAIEAFDRLRYVWRGDEFEFAVLRRLGELTIAQGDVRAGLITWKRAATNFPNHRQTKSLTVEMRNLFRELYVGGGADDLSPIAAIALFEEFRELVPAGEDGDVIIERLADRLVAVDLLGQAADLLQHQVEFRLTGEDKARVGARLALIHLLNGNAVQAFQALLGSEVVGVAPRLQGERRLLAARTQIELGEGAHALSLLANESSVEAERLRAQIFWHAKDWQAAAAAHGRLAGPVPPAGAELGDERGLHVLSQAVALSLAERPAELRALGRTFGPAMETTSYASDFRVIAGEEPSERTLKAVLKKLAAVDDYQAFLANYRERVTRGGLTAID